MIGACPVSGPDEPFVRGMISTVDCNVRNLVRGGYAALSQETSGLPVIMTALLTIVIAAFGYRLLLGRASLQVGDLVLTAAKIGVVLALTTRWDTYQVFVADFFFSGPQQLANAMLSGVQQDGATNRQDVFEGLERAFDALQIFAANYAQQAPPQASPLIGGPGFGALALTMASAILLFSSVGVVLVTKILLGLLLAIGPVFIALLLFENTRGIFEGWLRACLAVALAPLGAILLLGVTLLMLEPSLVQIAEMQARGEYDLRPVYSVFTIVMVCAGVSFGVLVAGGMIANGLRLPQAQRNDATSRAASDSEVPIQAVAERSRAARTAEAAASLARRDATAIDPGASFADRRARSAVPYAGESDRAAAPASAHFPPMRRARPRPARTRAGTPS